MKQQPAANMRALDIMPIREATAAQTCSVELPRDLLDEQGQVLDWVIGYAFDTLHARHLDLRIVAGSHAAASLTR